MASQGLIQADASLLCETITVLQHSSDETFDGALMENGTTSNPILASPNAESNTHNLLASQENTILCPVAGVEYPPTFAEKMPADQDTDLIILEIQDPKVSESPVNGHAEGSRKLMWIILFFFTLVNGMTGFLFRLEVFVDGDNSLDAGTFMFYSMIGSIVGHIPFASTIIRPALRSQWSWTFVLAFLAGVFNNTGMNGYVLMNTAGGEASLLAPLSSLFIIIPIVAGFTCLGDSLTVRKSIGIFLAIGASLMFAFADKVSSSSSSEQDDETFSFDGPILGYFFMCLFGWGFATLTFQVIGGRSKDEMAASFLFNIFGYIVTGYAFVYLMHDGYTPGFDAGRGLVIGGASCHSIANALFVLLARAMPSDASIVAPLSSLYVLWPVLLGVLALGESFYFLKGIGIVCAILGVLLMGIKSFRELFQTCIPSSSLNN